LVACPACNNEVSYYLKAWKYDNKYYSVKSCKCPICDLAFRAYFHEGRFSHTVPKFVSVESRVLKYLKKHCTATGEQIAKTLGLKNEEVFDALLKLETEGTIR
jgi:hypothetical protein